MIILYGTRTAGRIHTADGREVSTRFFHVFFIPAIPIGSIEVTSRGLLRDDGLPTTFNWTSVLAAYLRHGLFALACVGFAMLFTGLYLERIPVADQFFFFAEALVFFAASFLLFLASVLYLGGGPDWIESRGRWFIGGVLGLCALLGIMFGIGAAIPREIKADDIAFDPSLSDVDAIRKMAEVTFPEHADVVVSEGDDGIELDVSYAVSVGRNVEPIGDLSRKETTRILNATLLNSVVVDVKELVNWGEDRGLSRIRVTLFADDTGQVLYRVNVPKFNFRAMLNHQQDIKSIIDGKTPFEDLGLVEIDKLKAHKR